MLYQLYETQRSLMEPFSDLAAAAAKVYANPLNLAGQNPFSQRISAAYDLMHRLGKDYEKPVFGINTVDVNGVDVAIFERVEVDKAFCELRRFKRFSGSNLAAYLHGSRIGVVVEFDGDATAAKDVAMHVAAMKPVALTSADVPADLIAKERSVAEGKADEANKELVAAGKPAQSAEITAKRIDGAVQKYLKEVSLADQVFVKAADGKQTVGAMLKEKSTAVKGFTLYVVGEGIEKKVDDFAAEVAAQVAAAKAAA